jgi:hypothetical protein
MGHQLYYYPEEDPLEDPAIPDDVTMIVLNRNGVEIERVNFQDFKAGDWAGDYRFLVEKDGVIYPKSERTNKWDGTGTGR